MKITTEHQALIKDWYRNSDKRIFIISGYAGCGKTTYARDVPELLGLRRTIFLAPTGKAATILSDNASTIHSYLYETKKDELTGKLEFKLRSKYMFDQQLLIVDEISMVSDDLMRDLLYTNIKIIGLGDPAQLPPVNGTNDILLNPNILLTHVWRHDGGLLDFATDIRQGKVLKPHYEHVFNKLNIWDNLKQFDPSNSVIICRYNDTRKILNYKLRYEIFKYIDPLVVGEKIMILRNDKSKSGLMNGQIVQVVGISHFNHHTKVTEIAIKDTHGFIQTISINFDYILMTQEEMNKKKNYRKDDSLPIDYAYAITCHKAQGSEYDNVWVINQSPRAPDHKNWLYTAVTRARKSVVMFRDKRL